MNTASQSPLFFLPPSSSLSEDYILTANIPVKPLTTGSPYAVFQGRHRRTEGLAVLDDSALYYIYCDYTNAAGWNIKPLAAAVTSVVAGSDGSRTLTAFYTDDNGLYQITLNSDGSWTHPVTLPWCGQLRLTNVPLTEELVAYGVTASGSLQIVRQNNGVWSAAAAAFPSSLAGAGPTLAFTNSEAWVLAAKNIAGGGELQLYTGTGSAYASGPLTVPTPAPVSEILLGYVHGSSALFLFTDTNNNLYTNYNFTSQYVQVPNALVTQGSAVLDHEGLLHFYGVTPGNQLWVVHQTSWDKTTGPVWAPAIPLDINISSVCVSTTEQRVPHFMAVGQDNYLKQYTLDPRTRVWRGALVQQPSEKAFYVNQYRTEIAVIDSSGNPVPGVAVSITAESSFAISSGSVVYPVGPEEPAVISTNNMGKITVASIVTGLGSPALTMSAAGVVQPVAVKPDRHVNDWLNGKGALNNAGTLSGETLLTGTLRDGSSVAPRLQQVPPKAQQFTANKAAEAVLNSMAMQTSGASSIAGFALDLSDPEHPAFHTFQTHQELQAYHTSVFSVGGFFDNIWDDVEDFAEDVWHGIEKAATTVWHWVVDVANRIASLVVKIGDAFYSMLNMVLEGIEDILSLVQSIFNAIWAFVDKVINFIIALFQWGAMWNTTLAFEQGLTLAFPWATNAIEEAKGKLDRKFFADLKADVLLGFNTLKQRYGAGQTMQSLVDAFNPPVSTQGELTGSRAFSGRTLVSGSAGSISAADINANVQSGWMMDKLLTYAGDLPASSGQPPSIKEAFEEFWNQVKKAGAEALQALEYFGKFIADTLKDPRDFTSLALIDLLNAVESLVLAVIDLAQAVVDAFFDVLLIGIQWIADFLTAPLEIPLVSELFKLFQQIADPHATPQPMTIGNLVCFTLAVPCTIAYKTVYGNDVEPFPNGTLTDATANSVSFAATGARAADSTSSAATGVKFTAGALCAIWALVDTALDAVPTMSFWPFTAGGLVVPALINVLTWPAPNGIPFTPIPLNTRAETVNFINWIGAWLPVGVDGAFIAVDPLAKRLARYNEAFGMLSMTLAGAFYMSTGIAASVKVDASAASIASNILFPCSPLFQFLRLQILNAEDFELFYIIKLLIDFFTGEGAATALFAT